MTLRSSVLAVRTIPAGERIGYGQTWVASKTSKIATVGIGYADGYPRHCKNGTPVMIRGKRAYLAGRVSMDMITIDVTHIDNVAVGDEVELWGQNVPIQEVAANADTIDYELMTALSTGAAHCKIPLVISSASLARLHISFNKALFIKE